VALGTLAVLAIVLEIIKEPPHASGVDLNTAAEALAESVAVQWRREEQRWRIHDPFPLPVRWGHARAEFFDHWPNIRLAPAGEDPGPIDLSGRLEQIVDVYRNIPSGRLVVLGVPGSGKTILTLRFVLDMLRVRTLADPVPVIFSLGSWNPTTTSLRSWLRERLVRDHPGMAAPGPNGASLAEGLLDTGRILPVLDGFDEIAVGLHRAALQALNATAGPLVLTSRPAEYAMAVRQTDVLTKAAGIELANLSLADLADYLPRTTRRIPKGDGSHTTVWHPVLAHLREHPTSPATMRLLAVLSSPLMVTMARTIYSDTPGHDPTELLDGNRFRTPELLQDYLLAVFIPAVYQRLPAAQDSPGRDRRQWRPDRAQHWLGYVATHLNRLRTRDFAWWQAGDTVPRAERVVAGALLYGVTIALVGGLPELILDGFKPGVGLMILYFFVFGLVGGLVLGVTGPVQPTHTRLRLHRQAGQVKGGLMKGLTGGLLFGLITGCVGGAFTALFESALTALLVAFGFVLAFVIVGGLVSGLLSAFTAPVDITTAASPTSLLAADRARTAVRSLIFGLVVGVAFGFAFGLVGSTATTMLDFGLALGLAVALTVGVGMNAWGRWLVLSRIWLPFTGRLPVHMLAFLDDACRRGVLRQVGPVYQFRHAQLQDHLTRTHQRSYLQRQPRGPAVPAAGWPPGP
jgi:hypothetical protein